VVNIQVKVLWSTYTNYVQYTKSLLSHHKYHYPFMLHTACWTLPCLSMLPFPVPFTSPYRWRQQGPPKCWCSTATLHSVTTQKTSYWISFQNGAWPYLISQT